MRRYGEVESWVAGAIGRPGERSFFIQFTADDGVHGFLVEKGQVAALVVEAGKLLAGFESAGAAEGTGRSPATGVVPEFRVAEIHLAYEAASEIVTVRLIPTVDDADAVEFVLTAAQFATALGDARGAVEGGRPPCPRCGLAMDPDGHACPVTNGDLRGHRP